MFAKDAWLLFKVKDKYFSKEDITLKDKSVISKKTLTQVEKTKTNFYEARRVKKSLAKNKKETSINKRSDVKDLMQKPLSERRTILKQIIPDNNIIRFSESFEGSRIEFFETAKKMGLEGIMAKKSDSIYSVGNRSKDWLKIEANKRQEMVIGGYTKNEDTSKSFSSLLLGVYEKGKLIYTGKVGVTTFVLRNKESLAILKPYKNVIVLNRIRFSQEKREPSELKLPPVSKTKTKEMDMAHKLVEQLTEEFNIEKYKDNNNITWDNSRYSFLCQPKE